MSNYWRVRLAVKLAHIIGGLDYQMNMLAMTAIYRKAAPTDEELDLAITEFMEGSI